MDAAWIGAVSALGGVALGQVLNRGAEYDKWLRTEQHQAATELLAAGEALRRGVYTRWYANHDDEARVTARTEMLAARERLRVALEAFRLVFPVAVMEHAQQYADVAEAFSRINVNQKAVVMHPGGDYPDYFKFRDGLSRAASLVMAPRSRLSRRARRTLQRIPDVAAIQPASSDDEDE